MPLRSPVVSRSGASGPPRATNNKPIGGSQVLQQALERGIPAVFNTDQGVQFATSNFTSYLEAAGIRISIDGKGRALDNLFVERLFAGT